MTEDKIDDLDEDFQEISDEEMGGLQGGARLGTAGDTGKVKRQKGNSKEVNMGTGINPNQELQDLLV